MNVLLALATAGCLILAFPRFNLAFLAAVALAPLLVALAREPRHGRRFLLGWLAGAVSWGWVCYWIQFVLNVHGGLGAAESWGAFLLFCLYKGLPMAVFGLAAGPLMRRVYAVPAVAAVWVALEWTHGPMGFAWLTLGNAGANMSVPLRLAPYTGVYGLSFALAMMGTAVAVAVLRRRRLEMAWLGALLLLYVLPDLPAPKSGGERAILLQPNLSQTQDWTWSALTKTRVDLAALSLQTALRGGATPPRLLVWPEVPAPFVYDSDPELREQMIKLARATQATVVFGVVGHSAEGQPLNSAVLIGPDGRYLGRYDKMNLVPFGEYVPPMFGFVNRITGGAGDFHPGTAPMVFPAGGHKAGVFICYEAALPGFVRRFAAQGADVFVNLSNDGYFGRSAAREQHLSLVRMRAAENHRWILRSTNDGITVAVDVAGRILDYTPPYQRDALDTRFSYSGETTLYTRYGDWFPLVCAAAGLAGLAGNRRRVA
ncbi:MAG: apolipoprotein N-acyltransferase [Bryobacterales bacterium]|nr:apolipoprotein N-acyltransferase [Bryobacterales bacterium]